MKCKECNRKLPNESFITAGGCLWCDYRYYVSKEEEKRLDAIMEILKYEF